MEKRYQVFISSTYSDLEDERQEVIQALLELDCIPSGMELFPAANEDQWSLIKKIIDDCDYYLVIIAGRYGSIGQNGLSYTEMEYRYANEKNKPIIAFINKNLNSLPVNRCETDQEARNKLNIFIEYVQKKMCKFWVSPSDLGSQVSRSLIKLIKTTPAIGWIRSNEILSNESANEILKLKDKIVDLEQKLENARTSAPEGTDKLSQGEDIFEVNFKYTESDPVSPFNINFFDNNTSLESSIFLTWNEIFINISPLMINETSEIKLIQKLNQMIQVESTYELRKKSKKVLSNFSISNDDFNTIKVQFRALGLICKSSKGRSVKDVETYWTLTPYGDNVMTRLIAKKK